MKNDPIESYIQYAKSQGLAPDQIQRFLQAGYVPLKPLHAFHRAARDADNRKYPRNLGLGGTRGSAKTHHAIAQIGIDDCQRIENLKWLFLRKTQKAAGESLTDLTSKVLNNVKCIKNTERIVYPNGSKIIIGGYKDEKEIDNYIGQEYDGYLIEEQNQLSGEKQEKILGSLRTSKPNWRPRIYSTFNPGGIGAAYTKALFIDPWQAKSETKTKFFETWYYDNPFIDLDYVDYLEGLTGWLARIWRDNDWVVLAGKALKELNQAVHGFSDQIPDHWPRYISLDYGHSHPWAAGFFALDYDGRIWMYDEIYGWGGEPDTGAEENIDTIASRILQRMETDRRKPKDYKSIFAGPDWFSEDRDLAGDMAKHGIMLTKVTTPGGSRVERKGLLHNRLAGDKEHTRFKIHVQNCFHTWRTLPLLTYKEGTEDIDSTQEDHLWDLILLMISQFVTRAERPPEPKKTLTRQEKLAEIRAIENRRNR